MKPTRTTFALFLFAVLALMCAPTSAKRGEKNKEMDAGAAAATDDGADAKPAAKDKSDAGESLDADADADSGADGKKAKGALKKPAAVDPSEPGTVEGKILDKKKAPLAGVTVALYGKRKGDKDASNIDETVVGADGSFKLEGPAGAYRVIVSDNDMKLGTRSVRIKPGGTSQIEMRLSRKVMVSDGAKGGGKKRDEGYGGGACGITGVQPADRAMDNRAGNRRPGSTGQAAPEQRAGDRSAGGRSGGGGGRGR